MNIVELNQTEKFHVVGGVTVGLIGMPVPVLERREDRIMFALVTAGAVVVWVMVVGGYYLWQWHKSSNPPSDRFSSFSNNDT